MKEGRAPLTPLFWPQMERWRKVCVLAANREVKEGRAPFTPLYWPQTERQRKPAVLSPRLGFGHKPSNAERRFCTEVRSPITWEFARASPSRHCRALFAFRVSCFLIFDLIGFLFARGCRPASWTKLHSQARYDSARDVAICSLFILRRSGQVSVSGATLVVC